MDSPSKSQAQKRIDEVRAFRRELERLKNEHVLLLSGEQHEAISLYHRHLFDEYYQQYDIDADNRAKQLSMGMRIASFFGALALAASVFFLFYQFWGLIPTLPQVAILFSAPVLTFIATLYVRQRETTGYFAKLMALVCFATFVLNISLLGQIFNLTPSDGAFLLWAGLAVLLAYSCDVRLLLGAGIICLSAFIAARVGTWSGMYWLHFGERPENFFPAAVILFSIPLWIEHSRFWGFASIYRVFALLLLFLPMLVLANWGYISYLPWDPDIIEGLYQVLGFVFSILAIGYGVRRSWNEVVNTGNAFFVIFLYTKFFDWWWDLMPKYLFFLIIGLTAILFLLVFNRLRKREFKLFESEGP